MMTERLEALGVRVLFLASLCTDPTFVERTILKTKLRFPEYRDADPEEAFNYFMRPIEQYEVASEGLNDTERCSHTRIVSASRQLIRNDING